MPNLLVRRLLAIAVGLPLVLAGCVSVSVNTFALVPFVPSGGGFTVSIPGGTMTDAPFVGSGHFAESTIHAYSVVADRMQFAVLYGDTDPSYLASTSADAALQDVDRANVATIGGTQTSEQKMTIAGYPGREQRITGPQHFYRFRALFVGHRLYSISVSGAQIDIDGAEGTAFLDSFKLTP